MGWFGKSQTITTGEELDAELEVRCRCHACGKMYKPKAGDERSTCPTCQRNGHHGDAHSCQACENVRHYTR